MRRKIKVGTNFISQRNTAMFCISNFTIPFTTHSLKKVTVKFENILVNLINVSPDVNI